MQDRPLITLERVSVRYARERVLGPLDWSLRPGESWLVTGGNGAGKTTLLKLLAGELWPAPDGGQRRYDFGYGPERDAVGARRRVMLVGPHLQDRYARRGWNHAVEDVVLTGVHGTEIPRLDATPAERETVRRLLGEARLTALAGRRFLTLSRGEQRAALIARALARKPAVLLLDEVFDSLDAPARARLADLVTAIAAEGVAVVIASQSPRALPAARRLHLEAGLPAEPPTVAEPRPRPLATDGPGPGAEADERWLVRIANASVYRDGHPSITHLTWTWHPGEHWLVTGPNGAGKSTLLRLLYAAERPARHGRIEWAGHPAPFDIRALRRGIGYVSPALQSDYRYYATVEQCVLSGHHASLGLVRPVSGDERRRARDWLERLALDHLASRPVERLSYGQFRRVLIARAMVTEPRLLLLDEADSTLDQAARTSVYAALAEARATGTHLALATHTPDDAAPLFTHRLRLAEGRLISATPLAAQNRVSA